MTTKNRITESVTDVSGQTSSRRNSFRHLLQIPRIELLLESIISKNTRCTDFQKRCLRKYTRKVRNLDKTRHADGELRD